MSTQVLDPWVFWSVKANSVFDAKVASMNGLGVLIAVKKREGCVGFSRQYTDATLFTGGGADVTYAVNGDIPA